MTAPSGLFVVGMAIDVMAVALVIYSRDTAPPDNSALGDRGRVSRSLAGVIAWTVLIYRSARNAVDSTVIPVSRTQLAPRSPTPIGSFLNGTSVTSGSSCAQSLKIGWVECLVKR